MLETSGIAAGSLGEIQDTLWALLAEGEGRISWAISAFPSVHVGVATMIGIYLAERSRFLMPLGVAFIAMVLFLSVYTGFHYALDGYFSIAAVIGLNVLLKRGYQNRLHGSDPVPKPQSA
jgi:PAP2 superfamily